MAGYLCCPSGQLKPLLNRVATVCRIARSRRGRGVAIAWVWLAALPFDRAVAADLLRLSGVAGQSQVEAHGNAATSGVAINSAHPEAFKETRLNFWVMTGLHPIPLLSAEVRHIDLGHSSGHFGGFPTDSARRGTAAFGVFHLPLPLASADVYAKGGIARLRSTLNFTALPTGAQAVNCPSCSAQYVQMNHIKTSFAGGAGTQIKLGSLELRGEYQQFIATGSHPKLLAVGFAWNFR